MAHVDEVTAESWKALALYLADCHAATAGHEALLSSTSKSARTRFANIARNAADMLENKMSVPYAWHTTTERIVERLRRAVEDCDAKDQGVKP